MKTFLSVLAVSLISAACGNGVLPADSRVKGGSFSDRQFVESVLSNFQARCSAHGLKCNRDVMTVKIVDAVVEGEPDTLGMCTMGFVAGVVNTTLVRAIALDRVIIAQQNPETVALIVHESFHCMLDAPHFDKSMDIMNTFNNPNLTSSEVVQLTETVFERLKK